MAAALKRSILSPPGSPRTILAISAHEYADPHIRAVFGHITGTMTNILLAVRGAMREVKHDTTRGLRSPSRRSAGGMDTNVDDITTH